MSIPRVVEKAVTRLLVTDKPITKRVFLLRFLLTHASDFQLLIVFRKWSGTSQKVSCNFDFASVSLRASTGSDGNLSTDLFVMSLPFAYFIF